MGELKKENGPTFMQMVWKMPISSRLEAPKSSGSLSLSGLPSWNFDLLHVDITACVAKFIICARHLCEQVKPRSIRVKLKGDLLDVSAHHIEHGSRLDEITMHKFLKHCVVVLRIVAGDVPDLKNRRLVVQRTSYPYLPWAQCGGNCTPCKAPGQGARHCEPYSFE